MRSAVTVDSEVLLLSEDLQQLVEAAEQNGTLRQSELNDVLEPLELDPLEVESIIREIETRAIELVNDVVEDAPEPVRLPPVVTAVETTTDALQLFLRETGRHPLLTAAQE